MKTIATARGIPRIEEESKSVSLIETENDLLSIINKRKKSFIFIINNCFSITILLVDNNRF